jgi:hypothetical protein
MRPDQDPDDVKIQIRNQCCRTVDKPRDPDRTRDLFGLQLEVSFIQFEKNRLGHSRADCIPRSPTREWDWEAETQYAPALAGVNLTSRCTSYAVYIYLISIYVLHASRHQLKQQRPDSEFITQTKQIVMSHCYTRFAFMCASWIDFVKKTSHARSIFVYGLGHFLFRFDAFYLVFGTALCFYYKKL